MVVFRVGPITAGVGEPLLVNPGTGRTAAGAGSPSRRWRTLSMLRSSFPRIDLT